MTYTAELKTRDKLALDALDEVAHQAEKKYGVGRLPLLVSVDLAERFHRQAALLNDAILVGSIADVEHHANRMAHAWRALQAAAEAAGASPLSPKHLEARMPDGRLLVVVDGPVEAWCALQENRAAVVWTMAEFLSVISKFDMVNIAKAKFEGATVVDVRVKPDPDWKFGDELPDWAP
jgi:hypothetical protein